MEIEKYNIIIQKGSFRIIAEGPIQEVIDNSEYGGCFKFLFNMRIEDTKGKIFSPILNKVPFSSMRRVGADLDDQYTMEGFYLTNETFGYLRSESWTSLKNPSEWSRSLNFDISKNSTNVSNIEVDKFINQCKISYNVINGDKIAIINKYLDELELFEKKDFSFLKNTNLFSWDSVARVLAITPSI